MSGLYKYFKKRPRNSYSGGSSTWADVGNRMNASRNKRPLRSAEKFGLTSIGGCSFKGSRAPFKEKVFRSLYMPVTVKSRSHQEVLAITAGCACIAQQGFLLPVLSEGGVISTLSTVPQLLDLGQAVSAGFGDLYNSGANPFVNCSAPDNGFYIESEKVYHTFWNNTVMPQTIEVFVFVPKVEETYSGAIGPVAVWQCACGYEKAQAGGLTGNGTNLNFSSNALAYDDIYDHPTMHKYFNSSFSCFKKVKRVLAPGDQAKFCVSRGRRYVNMNRILGGASNQNVGFSVVASPLSYYKSLSYYVLVRVVAPLVKDLTTGVYTNAPATISWEMSTEYKILPCAVSTPKIMEWGGSATTSTMTRSAVSDNFGFINRTIDTPVYVTGNAASAGVDSEL